uniref:Uncharacterized protein n=1 Tax=Anguilla anguilla TaxID=7936 RepID=A0A0E9VBK2_ANGAN
MVPFSTKLQMFDEKNRPSNTTQGCLLFTV